MRYLFTIAALIACATPAATFACEHPPSPATASPVPLDPKTPIQLVRAHLFVTDEEQDFERVDGSEGHRETMRGEYTLKNPTETRQEMTFVVPVVRCVSTAETDWEDTSICSSVPSVVVELRGAKAKPTRHMRAPKRHGWSIYKRSVDRSPVYALTLEPGEEATITIRARSYYAESHWEGEGEGFQKNGSLDIGRINHDMTGAAAWSGVIQEVRLTMTFDTRPTKLQLPKQYRLDGMVTNAAPKRPSHTVATFLATEVEPTANLAISWRNRTSCHPWEEQTLGERLYSDDQDVEALDKLDIEAAKRLFDANKLSGVISRSQDEDGFYVFMFDFYYSKSEGDLAACRNEFYARYGYMFKKERYNKLFYKPPKVEGRFLVVTFVPNLGFRAEHISPIELAGARLIKRIEAQRRAAKGDKGAAADEE